jgi:hypothetical protein
MHDQPRWRAVPDPRRKQIEHEPGVSRAFHQPACDLAPVEMAGVDTPMARLVREAVRPEPGTARQRTSSAPGANPEASLVITDSARKPTQCVGSRARSLITSRSMRLASGPPISLPTVHRC